MEYTTTSFLGYDVFSFDGELKVSELPLFAPALQKHIQKYPHKNIVLEMSRVDYIDSSAIRVIVNLKKHIDANGRQFFLLTPSKLVRNVLDSVNLNKVIPCVDSHRGLQREVTEAAYEQCYQSTREDGAHRRLMCRCPVCGSHNVIGYLLNELSFEWVWKKDDPFPTASGVSEPNSGYFELLPVVCNDCYLSSTDPRVFTLLKDGKVHASTVLDDQSKMVLAKTIKRRKKMIEANAADDHLYFQYPRSQRSLYDAYRLAEHCAHSMAIEGKCATAFTITYLNYISIMFAPQEQKSTLIDACRTWATQGLNAKEPLTTQEKAICYFVLFNSCLSLDRTKEAATAHKEFTSFIDSLSGGGEEFPSLQCPRFWYGQAKRIWQKEIEGQSALLSGKQD